MENLTVGAAPRITKRQAMKLMAAERRKVWGSMTALAQLCGCTRQAIHQWADSEQVPAPFAQKLREARPAWFA